MLLTHTATSVIVKCLTTAYSFLSLSLGKKLTSFDTKSQRGSDLLPNACLKSAPAFFIYFSILFVSQIRSIYVMYTYTHMHINKKLEKTKKYGDQA